MPDSNVPNDAATESVLQKYNKLYTKIDKTARSRFTAARRCELHDAWSIWTVVILSCCVIGLALFDVLKMLGADAERLVAFLQVFAAVGVLAFSIILSKSDFALRAYKHHECGLALNDLKNAVYKHLVEEPKVDQYLKSCKQYSNALSKYDNHLQVDFDCVKLRDYSNDYKLKCWDTVCIKLKFWSGYCHYALFSLLAFVGLVYIYWRYSS